MPRKILAAAVVMLSLAPTALMADFRDAGHGPPATSDWSAQQRRARTPTRIEVHPSTRIEVYPSRRLYRQCVDWYALENRPSGPVITPQMRCWWAYR